MKKAAVDRYGHGFMDAVNAGRFFDGGVVYRAPGGGIGTPPPLPPVSAPAPQPVMASTTPPPGVAELFGINNNPGQPGQPGSGQGESAATSGLKSMQAGTGTSSPGLSLQGGAPGAAASMFPGGGLAEALAGRTVGYVGQLAAIGVQGLMQTFLPNDSPLANFGGTLPGKILSSIAGSRPAGKNTAGAQTPPQLTQQQVAAKDARMSAGQGNAPLVGEMHNHGVNNGEDVAAALSRQTYVSRSAGRTR